MKTKQLPKAEKGELDRKEWDFRSIPKSAIEACFIYEYARELARRSPRISALFAIGQIGYGAGQKSPRFDEGRRAYIRNIMTACFPDFPTINEDWFPDTSWQGLDQKVRSRLVEEVNNSPQHYWNSLPSHKLNIETMKFEKGTVRKVPFPSREEDISQTESGFFDLNWNYPDYELTRAFAEWLSEQRKDRKKRGLTEIKYKPKSRGGFRDRLSWLGALRVVNHYPKKQLVEYADTNLKVDAPYSHLTDLLKCAKKAGKLLDILLLRSTGRG